MNIYREIKAFGNMAKAARSLDTAILQFDGLALTPEEQALKHVLIETRRRLTHGLRLVRSI